MSIRLMTKVWEHSPYRGATLLLHLALADHANDEGVCWPSLATLGVKARLASERHVRQLLARMERDGAFKVTHRPGASNLYELADPEQLAASRTPATASAGVPRLELQPPTPAVGTFISAGEPSVTVTGTVKGEHPGQEQPPAPSALDAWFGRRKVAEVPQGGQPVIGLERFPPDVVDTLREVCELWHLTPPEHSKRKGGEFALWISNARELRDACGEHGVAPVLNAVRADWLAEAPARRFIVAGPGSLIRAARAKAGELRAKLVPVKDRLTAREWVA